VQAPEKKSGFASGFKFGASQQPINPRQESDAAFNPLTHFIDTLFELNQ
jgi:hypothetical protein